MPNPSQPLTDELRGIVRGPLLVDPLARRLYASDASPFHLTPAAVAIPADEDDLRNIVRYAYERGVAIVPRGAGTGLAGESLGSGIVLDLSVHFRKIGPIDADSVTVEPGVVLAELNAELAKRGRRFAPDPASGASCTIGGMIATNASGSTAFRHGYTRDYLEDVRYVTDAGRTCGDDSPIDPERAAALANLLAENRELLAANRPRTAFNRCGYLLHDLGEPGRSDGAKLMAGSEGTLGIVTRARLRTIPLAGGVAQFVLGFSTLEAALHAGPELRRVPGMAGCDVLDQRLLSRAKAANVPAGVAAALIGTVEAESERDARDLAREAVESVRRTNPCVVIHDATCEPAELGQIATFRESSVYGLYAIGQGRRPEAFVEDAAVPVERVADFVGGVQDLLRAEGINASFLVHLLAGQIHTRPLLDIHDPADRAKMWPLADRIHALTLELQGTISSQHGVGLARTPWIEKQYGPLMPVFRELKRIFDPKNILNPGKILGPDPSRPAWPMMPVPTRADGAPGDDARLTLLIWNDGKPADEAAKCNGCGDCRPRLGPVRMCPLFRVTGHEAATPRAKANALRPLDEPPRVDSDEFAAIARLCVNCKMCRDECRANVDVPKLMLEAKAAHYAEHGFRRHEWLLARSESLTRLASRFSWTLNNLLRMRGTRWLLEKSFGLSRAVALPRFTHRTFLRRAWWSGLTKRHPLLPESRKVAYFVDVFANYCDPEIGAAAVAVLEHHGFDVHVPRRQRGSGMTPLSYGDVDGARDIARYNIRALAELVRDGYTVVCSEPTAALALTHDYLALLDDADAQLVAANTVELMAFLGGLHERGELKPPTRDLPVGIGHHVPCHLKALGKTPAAPKILAGIPGLTLDTIDRGCSGMAGTWGLAAHNRELSIRAGAELAQALDRPRILYGSTECSACRIQMQNIAGKRTLHPVQWLAMAYGLMTFEL